MGRVEYYSKKLRLSLALSFFHYIYDHGIERCFVFCPEITKEDNTSYNKSKKEAKKAGYRGGERQERR